MVVWTIEIMDCPSLSRVKGGGRRGVPKTVKPPKYFGKTVKPPLNSAKAVTRFFHFSHISPWFYASDDCLLVIFETQKEAASSNAFNQVEIEKL